MSKFMKMFGLMLGAALLMAGAAQAEHRWFGRYDSQEDARQDGDDALNNGVVAHYAIQYFADDPTGLNQGEGYYLLVYYPDEPAQADPGILGVPLPGLQPGGLGADQANPGDDANEMD